MRNRFVILLFLILLSGCSSLHSSDNRVNSIEGTDSELGFEQLTLVTSFYGTFDEAQSEAGFYKLYPNSRGGSNLLYFDATSKECVYLCGTPNCQHQDDTCTSWFPFGVGTIFFSSKQNLLFCIGKADTEPQSGETIWVMEPDGSDRAIFYQCSSNQTVTGPIAASDESIYITVDSVSRQSAESAKQLIRIDVKTHKSEKVLDLNQSDQLYGAVESDLIFKSFQDNVFQYTRFDPIKHRCVEFYHSAPLSEDSENSYFETIYNDALFVFTAKDGDDTAKLTKVQLKDGAEKVLCDRFPWYQEGLAIAQAGHSGNLVVDLYDVSSNCMEDIKHERYFVNCETGKYTQSTLTYTQGDMTSFVTIVAEFEDIFIVDTGTTEVQTMLNGSDGTVYAADLLVSKYAFISKEDYWNNKARYEEIPLAELMS